MIDYEKGIRFKCQKCGACCNRPGYVYLNWDDIEHLIAFFHITEKSFMDEYTTKDNGYLVLKNIGGKCIFIQEDNSCRVQMAKPLQCTSWPFWTNNLKSAYCWERTRKICPGIGLGPLYDKNKIEKIMNDL